MLVIRQQQMAVFDQYCQDSFLSQLAEQLHRDFPEQVVDMDQAHSLVTKAVEKSARYDIHDEEDISFMAKKMAQEGEHFEEFESNYFIKKILQNKRIQGEDKVYEISKRELEMELGAE